MTKTSHVGNGRPTPSGSVPTLLFAIVIGIMPGNLQTLRAARPEAGFEPWTFADLIEPKDLAAMLSKPQAQKPLIVYVGFEFLYKSAHIPGALYFGPGRTPEGVGALSKWARTVSRDKLVVMYCGCCPWSDCPNIRPAFKALRDAGLTNLKLLHIPDNLFRDWISKGYPVEKGP